LILRIGETTVLPFTPKKKKRRFKENLKIDNISSLSFNWVRLSAIIAAQKAIKGLTTLIFSGLKEATAFSKEDNSLTKNKILDQIKEINV
jgi:hypothetical protein